jgi:ABC-type bacteriocin/lantibiotic exporter with double-glycine peptidase domain
MPKRLLPIKHAPQEVDQGCLAACAQMALAMLGTQLSQQSLNQIFDLTPVGVPLSRLKRLERRNFRVLIQHNGTPAELIQAIDNGTPPILFVRTGQLSYWQRDTQHAILLCGYDGTDFLLNDPAFPNSPQRVSMDELMLAGDEFDNIFAIITR